MRACVSTGISPPPTGLRAAAYLGAPLPVGFDCRSKIVALCFASRRGAFACSWIWGLCLKLRVWSKIFQPYDSIQVCLYKYSRCLLTSNKSFGKFNCNWNKTKLISLICYYHQHTLVILYIDNQSINQDINGLHIFSQAVRQDNIKSSRTPAVYLSSCTGFFSLADIRQTVIDYQL